MKVGIAGTGKIVREFLNMQKDQERIEVTALVCRPQSEKTGRELAEQYGIPALYTDYETFLKEAEMDAVYLGIVNQMHAREHIRRAGKVFVLTDDVRIVRRVRAEGGEFRAGKKQHREYVVRRGNRRAVRPLHAAGDIEGINHVAVFILVRIRAADGFVDSIIAVGEHRDGGIAVNQFTHIHIRRVVAPAIGKEIAAHLRQRADGDFLLLLFGIADACQQNQRK